MSKLIDKIHSPEDLRSLSDKELNELVQEIRCSILDTVSQNGGHLAPNLGVVELTLVLHLIFQSPIDKIIWDVGHQCYIHKIITGRNKMFSTLRKYKGISGFPKREESKHDIYGTGHSSTSISVALGLALARDLKQEDYSVIAVIGDGALTGGVAYEALNHAGDLGLNIIVILNDNEMSIDTNVGGMAAYLGRLRTDPIYYKFKEDIGYILNRIPAIGKMVVKSAERLKDGVKYLLVPGMIFEELGFTYLGPVNGHNISELKEIFLRAKKIKGPVLVHVLTKKGKGYSFAENDPNRFHGTGPFSLADGKPVKDNSKNISYTAIFGRSLIELAQQNNNLVAITAAMTSGTGLEQFSKQFPSRFFDVGIAEQHAVSLAAGFATSGLKPVVAIYSTFLQRAYDQIVQEISLQKLPVIFAIDRAGIVGEDGETHQGLYDIAYLRHIPNMTIMAPKDENELRLMLKTAVDFDQGPMAIRYPRSQGRGVSLGKLKSITVGKAEILRDGNDILLLSLGPMAGIAEEAANRLFWKGIRAAVINARFAKPLDKDMILTFARKCGRVITLEEHALAGGFGSAIIELLADEGLTSIPVKRLGIPDEYVVHGPREVILKSYGLDTNGIIHDALDMYAGEAGGKW